MRIAITGPLSTKPLLPHLNVPDRAATPSGIHAPVVSDLVLGYVERGIDIVVVTLDRSVSSEKIMTGPNLRLCVGPYRHGGRARDAFRQERQYVEGALRREEPDVVHAHWTYEFALGALDSGLPTLITIHDWAPQVLRYQFTPYRAVRLLMQLETLRRGQHFTAVSPYIKERVRRWTRIHAEVVPNALPASAFDFPHRPLNDHTPVLLAVNAGFSRYKNVGALLRAFSITRRTRPRCQLWLVGVGYGLHGEAHQWAKEHGVDTGVTFYGQVPNDEVHELMKAADLLVHPSLEESFGLVVLEAMAKGLPAIGGEKSGAVPWLLGFGFAGLLTDVRSPAKLAASINHILDTRTDWQLLSDRGYARAVSEFGLEGVLDEYWHLYEDMKSESCQA